MSFYSNHKEEFVKSSTKGLNLHLETNLADFPKANLIMAHGVSESTKIFTPAASYFNKVGFNVFRYDHRGHGDSDGTRGYIKDYTTLSSDLDKIVEFIKPKYFQFPTFIFGHSMGGETVLLYGTKYPKKVDGLLATDPVSFYTIPSLGKLPISGDPKKYLPFPYNSGLVSDKKTLDKYSADPANLKNLTIGIMNMMYDGAMYLRKNISKISDPFFLMQGNDDGYISVLDTIKAFPKIGSQDKELHVYPKLKHELLNEPTRKWDIYKEISQWINKRIY